MGCRWIVVVMAMGCGPRAGSADASAEGSAHDGDGSTGGRGSDTGADSRPQSESSSSDGETGTTTEDACSLADPSACPDGCYPGHALRVLDDACGTESIAVCLPDGPKPGLPLTTYWALAPSGPVFAEYGSPCGVDAQPDAWRECSGAPGEPADCACFCQGGYCRGDEERRVLDECGLASPCGQLYVDPQLGAVDHETERCVLEGLGVRTPGLYEIVTASSFSAATTRLYVFAGEDHEVARIEHLSSDVIACPLTSGWGKASRCTLASGAYFGECVASRAGSCVHELEAWVSECSEQPPTCG